MKTPDFEKIIMTVNFKETHNFECKGHYFGIKCGIFQKRAV